MHHAPCGKSRILSHREILTVMCLQRLLRPSCMAAWLWGECSLARVDLSEAGAQRKCSPSYRRALPCACNSPGKISVSAMGHRQELLAEGLGTPLLLSHLMDLATRACHLLKLCMLINGMHPSFQSRRQAVECHMLGSRRCHLGQMIFSKALGIRGHNLSPFLPWTCA